MDGAFDKKQARKAVQALLAFVEKERAAGNKKTDLISDEEIVSLVIATSTIPAKVASKPLRMYV